jgi:hypothetical protein
VVVFLLYGHKLEDSKGPLDIQLGDVAIQPAEDTGMVGTDIEDFVPAASLRLLLIAFTSISTGATRTLNVSWSRETAGCSSISMKENEWFVGI